MRGMYDIHCHILPGIDDGSQSLAMSVEMLKKEYEDGVRTIIATPHFRYEMFEPDITDIIQQFLLVRKEAAGIGKEGIELYLGCELHTSLDMAERLLQGDRLPLADSGYVLVEFSGTDERQYLIDRIREVTRKGFRPIIAHVERCREVRENIEVLYELKQMGALIQINADSISGKDGLGVKHFCKKVIRQNLLDFAGSDGHNMGGRMPDMGKCCEQLVKWMGREYAEHILIENPEKIIRQGMR